MRQLLLTTLFITGIIFTGYTQGFVQQNAGLGYNVFDKDGRAFVNPAPDVVGSPFYSDEWRLGELILPDNRKYDNVRIRLNLLSEEVHILDPNNTEIALARGYIKEVVWLNDLRRFQNGFPTIDNQDTTSFYAVFAEGKVWLLQSIRKVISQRKDDLSGETRREYMTYEDYYLYDGKTMQRIKKERVVINGKEMKFKSMDELKKAIDVFNAS